MFREQKESLLQIIEINFDKKAEQTLQKVNNDIENTDIKI